MGSDCSCAFLHPTHTQAFKYSTPAKHSYQFDHFRHQAKKSEVHASIIVLSAFSSFDVTVSATADRRRRTRKLMCHCS